MNIQETSIFLLTEKQENQDRLETYCEKNKLKHENARQESLREFWRCKMKEAGKSDKKYDISGDVRQERSFMIIMHLSTP